MMDVERRLVGTVMRLPQDARVLITGGSGFIGANLVTALKERCKLLNIDSARPLADTHMPLWTELDIREQRRLREIVSRFQPEFVFHLAARTDLGSSTLSGYSANTQGTTALLEALRAASFAGTAVFFSSMLVNRPGLLSHTLGDGRPDTCYGESKRLMECAIADARPSYRHIVARLTSIWGPGFGEPYRNFFELILRRRYINPASKTALKTFGYVSNLIYQVVTLSTAGVSDIRPVYLGDDPPFRIEDWADEIARLSLLPAPRRMPAAVSRVAALGGDVCQRLGIPFPLTSRRLRNMTQDNVVDLSAIAEYAGTPPYTRLEGSRLTLNWLKSTSRRTVADGSGV